MGGLQRADSAPSVRLLDSFRGWDASVDLPASPRWSQSLGGLSTRNRSRKSRDTFYQAHQKSVAWVPGPGTHRKIRELDLEPPKGSLPIESPYEGQVDSQNLGRLRDTRVPHTFSKSVRQASLTSLRKVLKTAPTLLPSNVLTPGPGAYAAFSSFGAPSGPTRKRYIATNAADNMGFGRPDEKFGRHIDPKTRWPEV